MAYRGSCPDMCPESERQSRFGLYMSIFEKNRDNQPDERAMVKEYRRSGADQEEPAPEDLRTPRALELTMDYLVCNILDDPRSKTQELALEWYDFLWDRLRAIRKDITQQNICDQASALLVERCARFHVHSCYAMSGVKNFDVDMNKRNLNDCLQMLRQMYHDLKVMGLWCPGVLEFQKYDILLHLSEDHLSTVVLMKTSDHRETKEMKFITQIFNAYTNNQYYKFFHLMESADYMTSCILSLYANKMRLMGFKTIVNACAPRQTTLYPARLIIRSLGFDDLDDLKMFAENMGIEFQEKDDGNCFLVLNRETFQKLRRGESLMKPYKSFKLIENKTLGKPMGLLVDGREELPQQTLVLPEIDVASDQQMIFEETSPGITEFTAPASRQEINHDHSYTDKECNSTEGLHELSSKKRKSTGSHHSNFSKTLVSFIETKQEEQVEIDDNDEANRRKRFKVKQLHDNTENNIVFRKVSTGRSSVKRPREDDFTLDVKQIEEKTVEEFNELPKRRRPSDTRESERVEIEQAKTPSPQVPVSTVTEVRSVKPLATTDDQNNISSPEVSESDEDESEDNDEGDDQEMFEEPLLRERTRRVLLRREYYKRDKIADMMPAGCYKVRPLKSRLPTLDPPPPVTDVAPDSRRRPTNSPQKSINTLAVSIEDEAKANEMFSQFIEEFENRIST